VLIVNKNIILELVLILNKNAYNIEDKIINSKASVGNI